MFSIAALQLVSLTDAERDELSRKLAEKNKKSSGGKFALASPAQFRAVHGDPAGWCGAEHDDYLTACDAIAATAPADFDADQLDFGTATGQAALVDIISTLAETADSELDRVDLDHYRTLVRPVTSLTSRRAESAARGWAA